MKVTIDSNEPLHDVLRVLGALYDVDLVVSGDVRLRSAGAPTRSARARRTGSAKPSAPVTNGELRSWARQNGLSVSGRGRVPATVVSAYRAAHPA